MTTKSLTPREIRSIRRNEKKEAQEDVVIVNWVFLPLQTPCLAVAIPRSLFEGPTKNVREIFAEELRKECRFIAEIDHRFQLFKVVEDIDTEDTFNSDWSNKTKLDPISQAATLDNVLSERVLNKKVVHLAVRAEAAQEESEESDGITALPEIQRYQTLLNMPGKAPSIAAKSTEYRNGQSLTATAIHDGRYANECLTVAPPLEIFHPIFGKFLCLLHDKTHQPTADDIENVRELSNVLAEISQVNESYRNADICRVLSKLLGHSIHDEANRDLTRPDGFHITLVSDERIAILIMELKKELGQGSCDPSTQAGLSMRRAWQQTDVHYLSILSLSHFWV